MEKTEQPTIESLSAEVQELKKELAEFRAGFGDAVIKAITDAKRKGQL